MIPFRPRTPLDRRVAGLVAGGLLLGVVALSLYQHRPLPPEAPPRAFSAREWRDFDRDTIRETTNVRYAMRAAIARRPWTGRTLVSVLEELGEPDLVLRRSEVGSPRSGAVLAVVYRYLVCNEGDAAALRLDLDERGRVVTIQTE